MGDVHHEENAILAMFLTIGTTLGGVIALGLYDYFRPPTVTAPVATKPDLPIWEKGAPFVITESELKKQLSCYNLPQQVLSGKRSLALILVSTLDD